MTSTENVWRIEHSIETAASPEAVWGIFRDVSGWKRWNAGIERIHLEGPFADGSWLEMKPPGQDAFRSKLVEVRENESFVDETRIGDLVVAVAHRIEALGTRGTRVTYAVEATGPGASDIGPAVASDFPEVLAALAAIAAEAR
jgi:hypothetical protein